MNARDSLAAIVKRLEAIEKILADYSAAIRSQKESESHNPQSIRAEITFDDASKRETHAEAQAQNRTQEKIGRYAFYAFLAALFYAGISALQLYEMRIQTAQVFTQSETENADASYKAAQWLAQLKIAQQQVKAAQDSAAAISTQMREDQRAWIHPTFGKWDYLRNNVTNEVAMVSIPITITNTGKTPARNIFSAVVVAKIMNGEPLAFSYNKVPLVTNTVGVLSPTDHSDFDGELLKSAEPPPSTKTELGTLTGAEYQEVADGKVFFIVYGQTFYTDIFNVRHWVKFCRFSPAPPGGAVSARACVNYDDVDKR